MSWLFCSNLHFNMQSTQHNKYIIFIYTYILTVLVLLVFVQPILSQSGHSQVTTICCTNQMIQTVAWVCYQTPEDRQWWSELMMVWVKDLRKESNFLLKIRTEHEVMSLIFFGRQLKSLQDLCLKLLYRRLPIRPWLTWFILQIQPLLWDTWLRSGLDKLGTIPSRIFHT